MDGSDSSVGIVPDEEKQENTLDLVAADGNYIVVDEEKHETILYVVSSDGSAIIQSQHVVVMADDIFVDYKTFKCLLRRNAYVINAYINLIRAEKHLLCRAESTIYLENTLIVGLLQRDGKNKEKIKPNIKEDSIVDRVMKYVAHDLVFLPINIEEMHWYLAVVNRKRREIQVLDSMGLMSRDDLGHVLDSLQLQIDAPDLQVSSWPVVEQFYHRMHTDGVSCGLFLLNFMEYWMGEKLSDTFSVMTNFRLKLAAILCDSTLNTAKELPDDSITDDYTFDTTEFVIENLTQLSQLTCIRYKDTAATVLSINYIYIYNIYVFHTPRMGSEFRSLIS
ncbi:hypothetical protein SETIT_8G102600v2 [Setaria italica]|uniref:Ubiquitin-like protease family profile domain-containing protein n=1 Tax=Setaria italica TaxID=4555 RepID=K3ZP09_SETIT|nr:hypothetical protein SETIT_8G102600v2 [Setaria italica]